MCMCMCVHIYAYIYVNKKKLWTAMYMLDMVCVCYMLYSHNMFVSVVYFPNVSMGFYGWNTSFAA